MTAHRKPQLVPLETRRLYLRPLDRGDAPRIQALFANPNVLRYMDASIPHPYADDGAEEFLRRWLPQVEARQVYGWSIVRKAHVGEGLIGQISLTPNSAKDHRGFWLGEPYWRQGYMTEAAAAVTDFAFDALDMAYLLLNNAEPNTGSHRLKELAGATIVARYEKAFIGGTFPSIRWKLTKEAWRARGRGESPTRTSAIGRSLPCFG